MDAIGTTEPGVRVTATRPPSLASLYRDHSAGATRLAYVLTGDAHAAEDIAQEAFVRVGRKLFGLRDPEHSRAYLYKTVVNLCRGRGRKIARERALAELVHSERSFSQATDEDDAVWDALLQLPVRQRAALFLRYYQDLSETQTAETMGCSVSAVKSLVNRALRQLRATVGRSR